MEHNNAKHEIIVPQDGFPFKMFRFEGGRGGYYRDRHWHRSVEIFAVFTGALSFHIDERTWELHDNEFMLVNSNEVHAVSSPLPNETVVIQIPLRMFEEYFTGEQFLWFSHEPSRIDDRMMELIRMLYDTCNEQKVGYKMRGLGLFYEIMYLLVTRYRLTRVHDADVRKNKNLTRLSSITSYMKENYDKDLGLDTVAGMFGYSPSYLSRMFKLYAGITFKDHLQGIRIGHALQAIEHGEESMTKIAADCGFSDSRAMARAFKKAYGVLPSEYKRIKKG